MLANPSDISTYVTVNTHKLGLEATKPVFGVSEKARLKPVSSATETN